MCASPAHEHATCHRMLMALRHATLFKHNTIRGSRKLRGVRAFGEALDVGGEVARHARARDVGQRRQRVDDDPAQGPPRGSSTPLQRVHTRVCWMLIQPCHVSQALKSRSVKRQAAEACSRVNGAQCKSAEEQRASGRSSARDRSSYCSSPSSASRSSRPPAASAPGSPHAASARELCCIMSAACVRKPGRSADIIDSARNTSMCCVAVNLRIDAASFLGSHVLCGAAGTRPALLAHCLWTALRAKQTNTLAPPLCTPRARCFPMP